MYIRARAVTLVDSYDNLLVQTQRGPLGLRTGTLLSVERISLRRIFCHVRTLSTRPIAQTLSLGIVLSVSNLTLLLRLRLRWSDVDMNLLLLRHVLFGVPGNGCPWGCLSSPGDRRDRRDFEGNCTRRSRAVILELFG